MPTDARPGGVPAGLGAISTGARDVVAAAAAATGTRATATLDAMTAAWAAYRASGGVPPLLAVQMDEALAALAGNALMPAVTTATPRAPATPRSIVRMAALDLQLQYRPPAEIDLDRFGVWADRLIVDTASDEPDAGNIAGDVTSLEWVWDRIAHTLDDGDAADIEAQLEDLRTAADDEDVAAAAEAASRLVDTVAGVRSGT